MQDERQEGAEAVVADATPNLSKVSDDELNKMLSSVEVPSEKSESDNTSETHEEEAKGEETPKEKEEVKKEPEPVADAPDEEVEKAKKQVADKEAFLEKRKKELEEWKSKAFNLEREIGRTSNQIHHLKKASGSESEKPEKNESNIYGLPDEPANEDNVRLQEAVRNEIERREALKQYQQIEAEKQSESVRSYVKGRVPNIEELFDDIAGIAKSLGATDEAIQVFKKNPWQERPDTLLAFASSALALREKKRIQEELDGMKKKSSQIVKKIANASNSNGVLTGKVVGKSSNSAKVKDLTHADIRKLPDDELDALIKKG